MLPFEEQNVGGLSDFHSPLSFLSIFFICALSYMSLQLKVFKQIISEILFNDKKRHGLS